MLTAPESLQLCPDTPVAVHRYRCRILASLTQVCTPHTATRRQSDPERLFCRFFSHTHQDPFRRSRKEL